MGRKTELAQLTEAFVNSDKRLAIIVAAGGIGKSALTDEWLQHIAKHNYYGKTRVFGWSFYSQGSHNTFTNSQPFFSAVLPFLGITEIPKNSAIINKVLATTAVFADSRWLGNIERLAGWTRRHMRKCFWLRWHNKKGRLKALKRLGAKPCQLKLASSSLGAWPIAKCPTLHMLLSNATLRRYGLYAPSELSAA